MGIKHPEKDPRKSSKPPMNAALKYSGMVGQLCILLFLAAYAGQWLDEKMANEKPLLTAALLIVALLAYLWKLSIDLSKPS